MGCHFLLQGIFPTQGWNLPSQNYNQASSFSWAQGSLCWLPLLFLSPASLSTRVQLKCHLLQGAFPDIQGQIILFCPELFSGLCLWDGPSSVQPCAGHSWSTVSLLRAEILIFIVLTPITACSEQIILFFWQRKASALREVKWHSQVSLSWWLAESDQHSCTQTWCFLEPITTTPFRACGPHPCALGLFEARICRGRRVWAPLGLLVQVGVRGQGRGP